MTTKPVVDIPAPAVHELINMFFAVEERAGQLGAELTQQLDRLILWELGQQLVWPQPIVDLFRWATYCKGIKAVGWDGAGVWAAERLAGSPWEGGAHAMKASYKKVQHSLPPEHNRPVTHRKRTLHPPPTHPRA